MSNIEWILTASSICSWLFISYLLLQYAVLVRIVASLVKVIAVLQQKIKIGSL